MGLKQKFDSGSFVVLAESVPPKGVDVSGILENALNIKDKIDAFVIPDMINSIMQMSSLACSAIFQSKGLETIMQICSRDRNRLALQADLLGAYGCGIKNIMAVTGLNPELGDHHQAKPVDDIDLFELLDAVGNLQTGKDMADIELKGSPEFFTGTGLTAAGIDIALELEDMNKKMESGANFFITTPIFNLEDAMPFLENAKKENAKVIPSVLLLKSLGMARYMDRNVSHINIPKELIKRLQKSKDKAGECIKITAELVDQAKQKGFDGILVSTVGQDELIPDILKQI